MKILMTCRSRAGSWQIRGLQLGRALGATCVENAGVEAMRKADVVVLIKRPNAAFLQNIAAARRPWIHDIIDCWPQPEGNSWSATECHEWIKSLGKLRPAARVFPTLQMQQDSQTDEPSIILPHHAWEKYTVQSPVRFSIRRVGYEGDLKYLGSWRRVLEDECSRRGYSLMLNGDMRLADVVVALRDPLGYAPRYWKANTKQANAHALGVPFIAVPEQSYLDNRGMFDEFVTTPEEFRVSLDKMADPEYRLSIRAASAPLKVQPIADRYKEWISQLSF